MNTKYIRVDEVSDGSLFCGGIFDDIRTAIGSMYLDIDDFHDSYRDEGSLFIVNDMYQLEDGGIGVDVEFKHPSWEKSETERYMVLVYNEKDGKNG